MAECECKFSELDGIIKDYGCDSGNLITILQKAQDIYGYLPGDVITHIAENTGTSTAKVIGVATFYTQFRLKPVGKYLIMLCKGTACHVNGSSAILGAITERFGINDGETTEDGLFSLKTVACLGCCSLSPVMMINGEAYGSLTADKAIKILEDILLKEKNI